MVSLYKKRVVPNRATHHISSILMTVFYILIYTKQLPVRIVQQVMNYVSVSVIAMLQLISQKSAFVQKYLCKFKTYFLQTKKVSNKLGITAYVSFLRENHFIQDLEPKVLNRCGRYVAMIN